MGVNRARGEQAPRVRGVGWDCADRQGPRHRDVEYRKIGGMNRCEFSPSSPAEDAATRQGGAPGATKNTTPPVRDGGDEARRRRVAWIAGFVGLLRVARAACEGDGPRT